MSLLVPHKERNFQESLSSQDPHSPGPEAQSAVSFCGLLIPQLGLEVVEAHRVESMLSCSRERQLLALSELSQLPSVGGHIVVVAALLPLNLCRDLGHLGRWLV